MPLEQYLPLQVYAFGLVFTRVAAMVAMMPGIGESSIPMNVRVFLAIAISVVISPLVAGSLPPSPPSVFGLLMLLTGEIVVGGFFGLVSRILLLTLDTAGQLISLSIGLSNASVFNPAIQNQASIPGLFLTTAGLLVLFAADMHHVLIRGIVDSYTLYAPGGVMPVGDFANALSRLIAGSFKVGFQLAAPFILISVLFFVGLGMVSRLMPQLQIFFVGLPIQLSGGILLFGAVLSGLFAVFLQYYADSVFTYLIRP